MIYRSWKWTAFSQVKTLPWSLRNLITFFPFCSNPLTHTLLYSFFCVCCYGYCLLLFSFKSMHYSKNCLPTPFSFSANPLWWEVWELEALTPPSFPYFLTSAEVDSYANSMGHQIRPLWLLTYLMKRLADSPKLPLTSEGSWLERTLVSFEGSDWVGISLRRL